MSCLKHSKSTSLNCAVLGNNHTRFTEGWCKRQECFPFPLLYFIAFYVRRVFSYFRVQFFSSCAWSSLKFNVWLFARPSISSLSRYRLVSIAFVSFAFLVCLIAFAQFVGCFILTLYLLFFSTAILHIGSLVSPVSPVVEVLE